MRREKREKERRFVSVKEFHSLLLKEGIEVSLFAIYKWIRKGLIPEEKLKTTRKLQKNGYLIDASAIEDILDAMSGNVES